MTTTPAPTEIDSLKALERAATAAPWRVADSLPSPSVRTERGTEIVYNPWGSKNDLHFIAAARNALPALLDELAKTRAELDEAKALLEQIGPITIKRGRETEHGPMHYGPELALLANPATTAEPAASTAPDPSNTERRRCPYCCTSNDGRAIPIFDGEYVIHLTGAGGRCSGSLKSLRALPPLDAEPAAS